MNVISLHFFLYFFFFPVDERRNVEHLNAHDFDNPICLVNTILIEPGTNPIDTSDILSHSTNKIFNDTSLYAYDNKSCCTVLNTL